MRSKFAEGLSFKKLFWIFIIGSIIGAYYEELLFIYRHYNNFGSFAWEPRRGVFWGPLSPIYGMGAVLMSAVLVNKKDKLPMTFLKASLLGGGLEYGVSFLQEFFLGTTSWNYANKILNINGRTTIPYMLFWGLLGVIFVKLIYPAVSNFIEKIPLDIGEKLTRIVMVIVFVDLAISWTALIRQTLRHLDIPQYTIVDRLYDEYFDDDYIYKKFPNMVRR